MKNSAKIAFCGVTGAVIILLMFLGSIIPIATYAVPCLASMLMMIAMDECGEKYAFALYFAVSALSLLIIADKELLLLYILILGYYPMLKKHIDSLKYSGLKILLKLIIFNTAIVLMYTLLLLIFPVTELISEFSTAGTAMLAVLILLANLTFFLLDFALVKILKLYKLKFRPLISKSLRS